MEQVKRYIEWSQGAVEATNNNKVSIFYLSAYGNTKKMAERSEKPHAAQKNDFSFRVFCGACALCEEMHDKFLESKVVVLGSPTINRTMVKPMWDLFSNVDPMANRGTIAGVFGSYGWSGEGISMAENTLKSMNFKMPVETVKKKFCKKSIEFEI